MKNKIIAGVLLMGAAVAVLIWKKTRQEWI